MKKLVIAMMALCAMVVTSCGKQAAPVATENAATENKTETTAPANEAPVAAPTTEAPAVETPAAN